MGTEVDTNPDARTIYLAHAVSAAYKDQPGRTKLEWGGKYVCTCLHINRTVTRGCGMSRPQTRMTYGQKGRHLPGLRTNQQSTVGNSNALGEAHTVVILLSISAYSHCKCRLDFVTIYAGLLCLAWVRTVFSLLLSSTLIFCSQTCRFGGKEPVTRISQHWGCLQGLELRIPPCRNGSDFHPTNKGHLKPLC